MRSLLSLILAASGPLAADEPTIPARPGQATEVTADDRPAYPAPPADFMERPQDAPAGKLEIITYESKTVGTTRRLNVYTPPASEDPEVRYPVLYLLHGIGGDETEWQRFARVDQLMDRLIAEKKATPMIVVMPNGRAQKDDSAAAGMRAAPAFAVFEKDLLEDVIPAIAARYPVLPGRESQAIAGLSMGGGQALNFGLGNLDSFAWVGAFSPAPNTKPPAELIREPQELKDRLKFLMLTCGTQDGLFGISKGVRARLQESQVPHVWHVDGLAHEPKHWAHALHHFAQQIFR